MNAVRTYMKKIVSALLVLSLLAGMAIATNAAQFATRYNADAAVSYARNHWDDGVGLCSQFVKDCLLAGGVDIQAGDVKSLRNALVDSGLGEAHPLVISGDGVHALASENPHVQPGDILFFYCEKCSDYIHTVMIAGTNSAGYLYSYGHNPGWDQVDWFGNFTHTLENGQQHRKCHQYIVVSMDRKTYSHAHNFTVGLYENNHPHKMYAQCSCGSKYYLGWNATVSSCVTCNPPAADVPLVTVTMEDSKALVTWTTVEGALEYQVWRARSANGTYFNIYSAMGTRLLNSSVEMGNTYYYKVVAVLEKDAQGNVTRSATSDVTSITISDTPAPGQEVADVSGSYKSFGTATDAVTIELIASGKTEASYTFSNKAAPANSGTWTVKDVALGTYTVRVMKKNHVTREYTITVGKDGVSLDVTIWLLGDVNGDGRVNFSDYSKVLSKAKNPNDQALADYAFQCGDVNGDGRINFSDYSKVLSQAKGNHSLW